MTSFSTRFDQLGYNYLCLLVKEVDDISRHCKTQHIKAAFPTYPHSVAPIDEEGTYTLYFSDIYQNQVPHQGSTRFKVPNLKANETVYLTLHIRLDYANLTTTFDFRVISYEKPER